MINNISWASYCYAVVVLLVLYYVIIFLFYYRNRIGQFIFLKSQLYTRKDAGSLNSQLEHASSFDNSAIRNNIKDNANKENLFSQMQMLIDELDAFFESATDELEAKELLLESLQRLLAKYPAIKNSSYTAGINEMINVACEKYSSIRLDEKEVMMLWKGKDGALL